MSEDVNQKKPWVLVSVLKQDADPQDAQIALVELGNLVDRWHSEGGFLWSGPFDDYKTSMSIFEATDAEAGEFFTKFKQAADRVVESYLYRWEAMPILSLL